MPKLIVLCGPAGSGKSTLAASEQYNKYVYVNQDKQGRDHLQIFNNALYAKVDILVDRMSFNVEQRSRYLTPAKEKGYNTEIIVLHQSYDTCYKRCIARIGHE